MRLIKVLLLAACLSCQSADSVLATNAAKSKELFEAFNRHDWNAMANYYTDSALFLDPPYGSDYVVKSRKETVAKYAEMQKMFSDIHDEVVGVYPSQDKVTVEFVSTGTAEDGSKFELPIVSILTFKDGLIIRDATYYDNL